MLEHALQKSIRAAIQKILDAFRGVAVSSTRLNHVLALLLLKYLSDLARKRLDACGYQDDRSFWVVTLDADFYSFLDESHKVDIGARIDRAFKTLEADNSALQGVFHDIRFDSAEFGDPEQRRYVLSELLNGIAAIELDVCAASERTYELASFACDELIRNVAALSGKKGGEFFTPPEVSLLIARLMQLQAGESVCDPCCGSGSLLLTCGRFVDDNTHRPGRHLHGQEIKGSTWALAKINMALHGQNHAHLVWGDTLRDPGFLCASGSRLQTFDAVVSAPPFNLKDWGHENAAYDPLQRYKRGIPPRSAGDYAFISHMAEMLNPDTGRMAAVVAPGVLFRSGAEQQIREKLLRENLIDAVIALPTKMFPHTGIAVALLVLRKQKLDTQVIFIDASRHYQHGKNQNILGKDDLARIESTYIARQDVDRYARLVSLDEILGNDCNLNVARYVDATQQEQQVDLDALRAERIRLQAELHELESARAALLQELDCA